MTNSKKVIIWAIITPFVLLLSILVAVLVFVYVTIMRLPEHPFPPQSRDIPQLEQIVEEDPSSANLLALAKAYRLHSQDDQWEVTIRRALDKANRYEKFDVREEYAAGLIANSEWERAEEYLGDPPKRIGWEGLQRTAWFYGATGRHDKGLPYAEMDAERCKHDTLTNYLLAFQPEPTQRTNALMDELYERFRHGDPVAKAKAAMIILYRNDPNSAVSILQEAHKASKDPWYAIAAALISEQNGWLDQRDETLARAVTLFPELENPSDNRKNMMRFIDMYVEANSEGLSKKLTEDIVLYPSDHVYEAFEVDAHAFAGELLRLKGENKMAKFVLRNAISIQYRRRIIEFFPYQGLRAMGEDPVAILDKKRQ